MRTEFFVPFVARAFESTAASIFAGAFLRPVARVVAIVALLNAQFLGAVSAQSESNDTAAGAYALMAFDSRFHPTIGANGMVTAQDALAAKVGRDILARGGNAVDAAVATGFALAVTHPQAGNIGGGGFMVIKLAGKDKAIAIDYREMAPAAATRDMFVGENGDVDNELARFSRLSAGVPGSVMGMSMALEKYGTMSLREVIKPAIKLADKGFPVTYPFRETIRRAVERSSKDPSSRLYLLGADGIAPEVGDKFVQKDLAKTLRQISKHGPAGFYEGPVADLIVKEMAENGGLITHDDLRNYKALEREVVTGTYRGYEIASMPPPSSGGIHIIQMLNILEGFDLKSLGHNSADYIHRLVEAMRRAYADRAEYLGDPDFFDVPVSELTDRAYGEKLRNQINLRRASRSADIRPGLKLPYESNETTHYSVIDKEGNAVAATTTLNFFFGGGFSVDGAGFFLNNEMDDFSSKPGSPNGFGLLGGVANEIEPGKRPLSSMTPTILMKDGVPVLVTGSPGGSTIITVVLQMILNMVDFDMNVMQATNAARIHHQWQPDVVIAEPGISIDTLKTLERRGFKISRGRDGEIRRRVMGRANSIHAVGDFVYGAADPRDPKSGVSAY
ncbi:MAG: gamma-glutamyltransferase [Pseudomonadota bacterium]